jgi:hypothetical protein
MKIGRLLICSTTTLLTLALSAPCFAQDSAAPKPDEKPAGGPPDAQMMATMMEMAKPGENHKVLEKEVGSWTYKVKWWMSPQAPPMESSGTCSSKSVMDGRYIISEHTGKMSTPGPDGKMMDSEFLGIGTEGYDNAKKKYVASWIDNMGTGIMAMEGTYDPATKTMTYIGEEEPMPGMKVKMRETIKTIDKDHHLMEFFEVRGDAEVKVMEIAYMRTS